MHCYVSLSGNIRSKELSMLNLNEYKNNVYSQYGEDGIIKKIFNELGINKGYFCEFGAWDGKNFSNTFALYEAGWSGCYIKGNEFRFEDLKKNITRRDVDIVNAFVSPSGENTLDRILGKVNILARKLDLLSIDIDSDDLAIWRSIKSQRPTVVVIEYNPTIPIDIDYENPEGENKGNSASSIYKFAMENDYDLVATTTSNMVFIDKAVNSLRFRSFSLCDPQLHLGYRYFWGYDGTLIGMSTHSKQADYKEVFAVPWNGSLFAQPINKKFRVLDQRKFLRIIGFGISILSVCLRRPFSSVGPVIQYVLKKIR